MIFYRFAHSYQKSNYLIPSCVIVRKGTNYYPYRDNAPCLLRGKMCLRQNLFFMTGYKCQSEIIAMTQEGNSEGTQVWKAVIFWVGISFFFFFQSPRVGLFAFQLYWGITDRWSCKKVNTCVMIWYASTLWKDFPHRDN